MCGALLAVAVDFDDRLIDIDEDPLGGNAGNDRYCSAGVRSTREATASSWRT